MLQPDAANRHSNTCGICDGKLTWDDGTGLSFFRQILAEMYDLNDLDAEDPAFRQAWLLGVISGCIVSAPIVAALGEDGLERIMERVFEPGELRPPVGRS